MDERERSRRLAHSVILGGEILRALRLDPGEWMVTAIHLDMKNPPRITLERLVTEGDGSAIAAVLEHYRIVPIVIGEDGR